MTAADAFDIVDVQVHLNRLGQNWERADPQALIARAIAAMDAVGVTSVLIDERAAPDILNDPDPNATRLPNGAWTYEAPFARAAVAAHPGRFAVLARADYRDPDIKARIAGFAADPAVKATQIAPSLTAEDWAAFQAGGYDAYFAACDRYRLPLFIFLSGRIDALVPYLARYPHVPVILDHWGFPMPHEDAPRGPAHFDRVLALARYPNLALKWCKGGVFLSAQTYPHADLYPYMRAALDMFGAERCLWASDVTQARGRFSWAESVFQLRDAPTLSSDEKRAVLGASARRWLDWPAL